MFSNCIISNDTLENRESVKQLAAGQTDQLLCHLSHFDRGSQDNIVFLYRLLREGINNTVLFTGEQI